jgi:parvulin-like peptidyl-prolyl isomerase
VPKIASRLLAGAALLAAALAAPAPADAAVVSRFIMRINDEVATLRDYEQRKAELEEMVLTRPDLTLQQRREALAQLGERVYRNMYEDLLLVSRAHQLGITVTDQQVDEQIVRIRERMELTSDEEFEQALAGSGMTQAQLREQTRKSLLLQTVLGREVYAKIEVDEEILRRYYRDHPEEFQVPERLHLRELVVLEDATPEADRRLELARAIRAEVLAGRPLDEVAAERSAAGATSGLIDHGWVAPGDLHPDLERAIWSLDTGALSEPIAARGGDHLVEVVAREPPFVRPFSEVSAEIEAKERERRAAREVEVYFARLEDEAFIDLDPPPEAAGFRRLAAERPAAPELTAPPAGDGGPPAAPEAEGAVPAAEETEPEGETEGVPAAEEAATEPGGDPGEPVAPSSPEPPPPGGA